MTAIIPANIPFSSGDLFPLRWLRLPLLILTLAMSCVCIAVGMQALVKSDQLEKALNSEAHRTRTTIVFDMNDIKDVSIVLTIVAFLLALTSLTFCLSLSYDWIRHLLHPKSTRNQLEEKINSSNEQVTTTTQYSPFSTRTLRIQTLVLSFLSVWLFAVLIPTTPFSRTRSAHLTVTGSDSVSLSADIVTSYWDYGFLRCLTSAPWFSLIFSLPATLATWFAWKYAVRHPI